MAIALWTTSEAPSRLAFPQINLCKRCLLAHARGAASIECPTCRETAQLPGEGVAGLKNNFALLGTLESFLKTR